MPRGPARGRPRGAGFVEDPLQARVGQWDVGIEPPKAWNDARADPTPAVLEARDPGPGSRAPGLRESASERVEVEGGEVRELLPWSSNLEVQARSDGEEPGEPARQAVEGGVHQGAPLMLEEVDVAVPDQLRRRAPRLGRGLRTPNDRAPAIDRPEPGGEGSVPLPRSRGGAWPLAPPSGGHV